MLVSWVTGSIALIVATWVLPGLDATSYADLFAVAAVVVALRPAGAPGAGLRGRRDRVAGGGGRGRGRPGDRDAAWSSSWWTASRPARSGPWSPRPGSRPLVSTVLTWLISAGTDESFTTALLRLRRSGADGGRPGGGRGGVRPARWAALPGGAVGPPVRDHADAEAVAGRRLARAAGVDGADALHDTGQPAGHPPGHHRGRAGLPLVRPRARSGPGGQPSRRRRRHRGACDLGRGAARRPGGVGLEPVLRGRRAQHDDDEPGRADAGVPRHPADRGALRAPAGRLHAQRLPDGGRGGPGALPGSPAASPARSCPGWSGPGSSPCCGR